jgi:putative glutamine amidotransferase
MNSSLILISILLLSDKTDNGKNQINVSVIRISDEARVLHAVHEERDCLVVNGTERINQELRVEADRQIIAVLDDFIRRGKPVLGICRGLQLINVYFGGTLIQHLPTSFRHFRPLDTPVDKRHGCRTRPGSWLEKIYGREFIHNSSHHQAVDRLAPGLVVDSVCPEDGVVEALHHETLPVYGVQWHPERMCLRFASQDMVNGLHVLRFFSGLCGGDPRPHDELEKSGIIVIDK